VRPDLVADPCPRRLYTVLLPVAFAVFGSSRHLVVAADSATPAIFSSSLSRMAVPASKKYMALAGMVALLTAGFLPLARIFKLRFLADFLSRTVLVRFLTGAGFQVGIAMLGDMFGGHCALAPHARSDMGDLTGLQRLDLPTLAPSTLVAGSILLGNQVVPRLLISLFAVVGTIAASATFGFAERGIAVIGPVLGGLPSIGLPDVTWSETRALLQRLRRALVRRVQDRDGGGVFRVREDEPAPRVGAGLHRRRDGRGPVG
jgi:sulfate permease, SulP family